MTDSDRILQLMDELLANPGYIDGRRSFPRTVTPLDALRIAGILQDEVDDGCAARAGAARTRHLHIVCSEGCNHCCEQPVIVYLPEAIRIARWLELPENEAARRAFLAAYPTWRERAGDGFHAITHARDDDASREAHYAQWRKKVMCAFNVDGRCAIYRVRPIVCRHAHALDTVERCKAENFTGELPAAFPYPPLDRAVERARATLKAAHHALGGEKNRRKALCQAVYELLAV